MIGDTAKELLIEAFPGQLDYYFREIMFGPIFDSAIMEWWASWNLWKNVKSREEQGFTDQQVDNSKAPKKITLVRNGKLIHIHLSYDSFLQLFSVATNVFIEGSLEDVAFLKKSILDSFKETGLEKINARIILRLRNIYGEPYPIARPKPKSISL